MKILLTVELYNPHKGGAEKVVEDLAKGLVEKGHDVTVATTYMKSRKPGNVGGVKVERNIYYFDSTFVLFLSNRLAVRKIIMDLGNWCLRSVRARCIICRVLRSGSSIDKVR